MAETCEHCGGHGFINDATGMRAPECGCVSPDDHASESIHDTARGRFHPVEDEHPGGPLALCDDCTGGVWTKCPGCRRWVPMSVILEGKCPRCREEMYDQ